MLKEEILIEKYIEIRKIMVDYGLTTKQSDALWSKFMELVRTTEIKRT